MKRIIRLTENDLARIVKRVIREEEMSLEDRKLLNKLQSQARGCFSESKYPCLYHTFQSMVDMEISLGLFALAALTSETVYGALAFGGEGLAMGGLSFAHLKKAVKSKSDCFDELQRYLNCLGWEDEEESIDWRSIAMPFTKTVESIYETFMEYATGDYISDDESERKRRRVFSPTNCSVITDEFPDKLTNKIVQDKKDGIIRDYSYSTKFWKNPLSGPRPTSNPNEDPYNYIILNNGKYCSKKPGDDEWVDATKYKTEIDRVIKDRKSYK